MYKCYVASSLLNAEAVNRAYDDLEKAGIAITYKWTTHGLVKDPHKCKEICYNEIRGVTNADALLFLHPARSGSHVELGIALERNIKIFMVFDEPLIEMKSFYYHDQIKPFYNYQEALLELINYFGHLRKYIR
jgi:hypothetical protein